MAMRDDAAAMLRLARRDQNALAAMVGLPQVADTIYGFHAQQAVEKALEAWRALRGTRYPLSHDLPRLITLLRHSGAEEGENRGQTTKTHPRGMLTGRRDAPRGGCALPESRLSPKGSR
jgi:O-acetyl-ADP-ribose deacetylase (regulator of RNase III)